MKPTRLGGIDGVQFTQDNGHKYLDRSSRRQNAVELRRFTINRKLKIQRTKAVRKDKQVTIVCS